MTKKKEKNVFEVMNVLNLYLKINKKTHIVRSLVFVVFLIFILILTNYTRYYDPFLLQNSLGETTNDIPVTYSSSSPIPVSNIPEVEHRFEARVKQKYPNSSSFQYYSEGAISISGFNLSFIFVIEDTTFQNFIQSQNMSSSTQWILLTNIDYSTYRNDSLKTKSVLGNIDEYEVVESHNKANLEALFSFNSWLYKNVLSSRWNIDPVISDIDVRGILFTSFSLLSQYNMALRLKGDFILDADSWTRIFWSQRGNEKWQNLIVEIKQDLGISIFFGYTNYYFLIYKSLLVLFRVIAFILLAIFFWRINGMLLEKIIHTEKRFIFKAESVKTRFLRRMSSGFIAIGSALVFSSALDVLLSFSSISFSLYDSDFDFVYTSKVVAIFIALAVTQEVLLSFPIKDIFRRVVASIVVLIASVSFFWVDSRNLFEFLFGYDTVILPIVVIVLIATLASVGLVYLFTSIFSSILGVVRDKLNSEKYPLVYTSLTYYKFRWKRTRRQLPVIITFLSISILTLSLYGLLFTNARSSITVSGAPSNLIASPDASATIGSKLYDLGLEYTEVIMVITDLNSTNSNTPLSESNMFLGVHDKNYTSFYDGIDELTSVTSKLNETSAIVATRYEVKDSQFTIPFYNTSLHGYDSVAVNVVSQVNRWPMLEFYFAVLDYDLLVDLLHAADVQYNVTFLINTAKFTGDQIAGFEKVLKDFPGVLETHFINYNAIIQVFQSQVFFISLLFTIVVSLSFIGIAFSREPGDLLVVGTLSFNLSRLKLLVTHSLLVVAVFVACSAAVLSFLVGGTTLLLSLVNPYAIKFYYRPDIFNLRIYIPLLLGVVTFLAETIEILMVRNIPLTKIMKYEE